AMNKNYLPNRVLSVVSEGADIKAQSKIISIAEGKVAIRKKTTAYVCTMGKCELPTTDVAKFIQQLNKK
ncbi:hypothetical protein MNBD_GAMMA08-1425, partial [hydrothermal vent metagenome]